jgi:hypothetical protein
MFLLCRNNRNYDVKPSVTSVTILRVNNFFTSNGNFTFSPAAISKCLTIRAQESTEKVPPHVVMTSLAYKTKCREKVIFFKVPVFMDNEGSA